MIFFKKLNNYEKSILLSTLFIIIFTSLNTGYLNFGNYSFLLVLIILSGIYFLAYRAINLISFSLHIFAISSGLEVGPHLIPIGFSHENHNLDSGFLWIQQDMVVKIGNNLDLNVG